MAQFKELKKGTPVYGAILLNTECDKVLMVQFANKNDAGAWSFPRGKLEARDHGDMFECAVREVRANVCPCAAGSRELCARAGSDTVRLARHRVLA